MIQGVLSGDVMAATFISKQRLARENTRLRRRITFARLRTEEAKRRLLDIEADRRERPDPDPVTMINRIREIYGMRPLPLLANPTAEIISEVVTDSL